MIQVTVRQFRTNLAKYLKVPCQVLNHGIPIASIVPVNTTYTSQEISIKEAKKVEKLIDKLAGDWDEPRAMGTAGPTATAHAMADQGARPEEVIKYEGSKVFWFGGKKYLVDDNGNEKEVK